MLFDWMSIARGAVKLLDTTLGLGTGTGFQSIRLKDVDMQGIGLVLVSNLKAQLAWKVTPQPY